jgi:Putative peptidoglycan binding domain
VPVKHVVASGEHLGVIARQFGYENFSVLWEHPENAALKELRKDPLQLAPGDVVFVPDRVQLVFNRATDSSHDFKVHVDTMVLKLRLLDQDGEPRKNRPVTLRVETRDTGAASTQAAAQQQTDADGNLNIEIASHVTSGSIEVDGEVFDLAIGGLDPIDTESGVAQRLANLGYLVLSESKLDPEHLKLAIQDFQLDHDLPATGEAADIQEPLKDAYGS